MRNLWGISSTRPASKDGLAGLGTIVFGPSALRRVGETLVSVRDHVKEDRIRIELGLNAAGMGDAGLADALGDTESMAL